jgi:branched-chain amino acid transport system permease protein
VRDALDLPALRSQLTIDRALGFGAVVSAALAPLFLSSFWISGILTQALWYGIAAAGLIFLSAYAGMVSLAQVSLYGVGGFVLGNVVTSGQAKGLHLGWPPWVGVALAIAITALLGLMLGAVASRSAGIYFLMLTLTFSVIANYFFGQVTKVSGFSGISGIQGHMPGLIGSPVAHPNRLFYVALIVSLGIYALLRYIVGTPFGLTLQGIRDDPVRMSSLGYNVALHRTLAFGFGAFVSSFAGILFVWWNDHIDPASIDLSAVIDLLVIAVIGGLFRLEGAWLGAFLFVVMNNYFPNLTDFLNKIPLVHYLGLTAERFHTLIGAVFLVIILLSPGGLMGIWQSLTNYARGKSSRPALATVGVAPGDAEARSTIER